ncbi:MAG: hypothetical protein F6K23_19655 [Okeania sp. SIO2C9]|uniref:hypothetical protein n=1 Tax=Okeania sp. SIO2C9 TaxID=2607791 RepID=UPI0013C24475|nr:hypothetical protein [Okeania sp. SIO2C9]NEQ75060.1 hypothetical protein [Okeania sp. SIO2C9]
MLSKKFPKSHRSRLLLLSERIMALLILANVMLVIFDITYIKIRHWYLKIDLYLQTITDTPQKKYIQKVDKLQEELEKNGLESPIVENLLDDLRISSFEIFINRPPFKVIDNYGSLAKIRKIFTTHTGRESFSQAVQMFWDENYLETQGWQSQLEFFNRKIRPLILLYEPKLQYDLIKGIEPFRDSQNYLTAVSELNILLEKKDLEAEETERLLKELRGRSTQLIDKDYDFQIVNQIVVLTQIKYRIKQHIYSQIPDSNVSLTPTLQILQSLNLLQYLAPEILLADKSSKIAFNTFWSRQYLERYQWEEELDFFSKNIQFLMHSFYFRDLGKDGEFVDRFWLVDLPWMIIFWIEFIGRTLLISCRSNLSLWGAVKKRWYDVFLLQPWLPSLRIITVFIRLQKVKLPDMKHFYTNIRFQLIGSFAQEIIQVVVGGSINQLQNNISQGSLKKAIFESKNKSDQVDVDKNDHGNIQEIINNILEVTACRVLPEIYPDIEDFLRYQVEKSMQQLSIYRRLQKIPFLRRLPDKIANNLVIQISSTIARSPQKVYQTDVLPDPVSIKLRQQLVKQFTTKFLSELQDKQTFEEIEVLMINWLEEIKNSYVKPSNQTNLQPAETTIGKIIPTEVIELKAGDGSNIESR